jgi:hypothetical protein
MTDMQVPTDRPENLSPTPDKIAAAVLLKQSLERLRQPVPPWVGELAASKPYDGEARPIDGRAPTHVVVQHGKVVYLLSSEEAQRVARRVQAPDNSREDEALPSDDGAK